MAQRDHCLHTYLTRPRVISSNYFAPTGNKNAGIPAPYPPSHAPVASTPPARPHPSRAPQPAPVRPARIKAPGGKINLRVKRRNPLCDFLFFREIRASYPPIIHASNRRGARGITLQGQDGGTIGGGVCPTWVWVGPGFGSLRKETRNGQGSGRV